MFCHSERLRDHPARLKLVLSDSAIKRAKAEGKYKGRVPTAMRQADKVKALVEAGVQRVQIQEQLGISKASYYRCLNG